MATLNRHEEIITFIDTLISQTYKNFELIIIDQNSDNRVYDIYLQNKDRLDIKYFRSDKKGLSLNRNIGLEHYSGDIVAFPDDDCEYDVDTLGKIASFFEKKANYNFYTCNTREKSGIQTILKTKENSTDISLFNVMNIGISFTIFIRSESIKQFRFDEQLGVGTEFSSGEESDLLLFLIRNNNKGYYHADHYIYHPCKQDDAGRAFSYGKGFGAIYKKAVINYKFYILLFIFILRISKGIINIIIYHNKKERIASLKGRLQGFIHYK
jgi:glycosyltransferase involved in cell wall biosynthesis